MNKKQLLEFIYSDDKKILKEDVELLQEIPIIYLTYKAFQAAKIVYNYYFSKAAKSCANKTGDAKLKCIQEFKNKALKAQIAELKKFLKRCDETKNPKKCRDRINKKIKKLESKIKK